MKMTVKRKLLLAFSIILALVIMVSANTWYRIQKTNDIQNQVTNLRHPTVLASQSLRNGVNLSLAGLRGYMILGKDPIKAAQFRNERALGWRKIDAAIEQLQTLSSQWTEPENLLRLDEIKTLTKDFRVAQSEIEDIAHENENVPSINMLLTKAAPKAEIVIQAITNLVDQEATQPATASRKNLLKLFADSRGSFALGLANIRAYLLSGDDQFLRMYWAKWEINQLRFTQIEKNINLLTPKQMLEWKLYAEALREFSQLPKIMFESRSAKDWNLANFWLGTKAAPKAIGILAVLDEMQSTQNLLAKKGVQALKQQTYILTLMMILGTFFILIIGIAVSTGLSRSITKPLHNAVERAKEIAAGNLAGDKLLISGNDEITELLTAFNNMTENLRNVIQKVGKSGGELSVSATQLSQAAAHNNSSMENQQREVEQVATAMNQMTATIQEVARNAAEASSAAEQADRASQEGTYAVEHTVQSINTLAGSIEKATTTINKLGVETEGVDDIVAVISGIADQTNLLALNAAIEAARAGEQGRGFAVVADEVRTLAARTQESTEEIRSMLDRLKAGSMNAVTMMSDGHAQAKRCVEKANDATESLNAITKVVQTINDMSTQIATASEEQTAVSDEINRNIVNINSDVEAILDNTRETGVSAHQNGQLALEMERVIGQFQVS